MASTHWTPIHDGQCVILLQYTVIKYKENHKQSIRCCIRNFLTSAPNQIGPIGQERET